MTSSNKFEAIICLSNSGSTHLALTGSFESVPVSARVARRLIPHMTCFPQIYSPKILKHLKRLGSVDGSQQNGTDYGDCRKRKLCSHMRMCIKEKNYRIFLYLGKLCNQIVVSTHFNKMLERLGVEVISHQWIGV